MARPLPQRHRGRAVKRGISAIVDAVPTARPTQPAAGMALICDYATSALPLVEGAALAGCEAAIYADIVEILLRQGHAGVVLHARGGAGTAAYRAAIERVTALFPDAPARLRVVEAERLEGLLRDADLLVSFASPVLIEGCHNGLKPVQIGRAVEGSAAFSHVFPSVSGFAEALVGGRLAGVLSVQEYEHFEEFCRCRTGPAAVLRSWIGSRSLAADEIVRACRPPDRAWQRAARAIGSAITNPFAVWRLLRARLPATAAR